MKKNAAVLLALLVLLASATSCRKNYNDYRNLVYGTWRLVSVDGITDTASFVQDTLAFTSGTAVTLTRQGATYSGQYSFYTNILTSYFSANIDLYQEWLVEKMQDSFMRAVVQVRQIGETDFPTGNILEYVKLP